jgi:hypothetical protein
MLGKEVVVLNEENRKVIVIPYSDAFLKGVEFLVECEEPVHIKIVSKDLWESHIMSPETVSLDLKDNADELLLAKIEAFENEKALWKSKTTNKTKFSRLARKTIIEAGIPLKCKICGYDKAVVVRHIDGNPENNSLDNLIVLCWNCHLDDMREEINVKKATEETKIP